ncbi:hypothetical protein N865_00450 [Intrasporangium oryzae NRRL B-24470]|uniref:Phosphatidylethanolamine-binding protein n=1 Tax=Intrasporangium oryzae NRRL B-24470 TaxID=1386089 RepID=W9GE88_9MICO|nr:hypothetical protein N865_00450 [Intrasporangium oryzae NRRL B-24470]
MVVKSTAFAEGDSLDSQFTCDGAGKVPPLTWSGVPAGAKALALVVDDPDAPRGTFTHWVVLDMPPGTAALAAHGLPRGAVQSKNSGGGTGYYPPCPPSGIHRYRFSVYALAKPTELAEGTALDRALRAVESNAMAQGRLTGVYQRKQ